MPRSLAYEAVNKPWRIPLVLRARRFGKLRQRQREADLEQWSAQLAIEARRARLLAAYGGVLQPWQAAALAHALQPTGLAVSLHTGAPGVHGVDNLAAAAPVDARPGNGGTVTFAIKEPSTVTYVGLYAKQGDFLGSQQLGVSGVMPGDHIDVDTLPPWMRRAYALGEDDDI